MVGIGPGDPLDRTRRAELAIQKSSVIIAYRPYLERIRDLLDGKEAIGLGMRKERVRCALALDRAEAGDAVALISSGDPGIYGMAGILLELAAERTQEILVDIVPGLTAASAAAARVGAPLMCDFAVISLSNLLVPWDMIRKRLLAMLKSDMVIALYNPRSRSRTQPFDDALEMIRKHRGEDTLLGIVKNMGLPGESSELTTAGAIDREAIDMHTTLILGNSRSRIIAGGLITERGYAI